MGEKKELTKQAIGIHVNKIFMYVGKNIIFVNKKKNEENIIDSMVEIKTAIENALKAGEDTSRYFTHTESIFPHIENIDKEIEDIEFVQQNIKNNHNKLKQKAIEIKKRLKQKKYNPANKKQADTQLSTLENLKPALYKELAIAIIGNSNRINSAKAEESKRPIIKNLPKVQ